MTPLSLTMARAHLPRSLLAGQPSRILRVPQVTAPRVGCTQDTFTLSLVLLRLGCCDKTLQATSVRDSLIPRGPGGSRSRCRLVGSLVGSGFQACTQLPPRRVLTQQGQRGCVCKDTDPCPRTDGGHPQWAPASPWLRGMMASRIVRHPRGDHQVHSTGDREDVRAGRDQGRSEGLQERWGVSPTFSSWAPDAPPQPLPPCWDTNGQGGAPAGGQPFKHRMNLWVCPYLGGPLAPHSRARPVWPHVLEGGGCLCPCVRDGETEAQRT